MLSLNFFVSGSVSKAAIDEEVLSGDSYNDIDTFEKYNEKEAIQNMLKSNERLSKDQIIDLQEKQKVVSNSTLANIRYVIEKTDLFSFLWKPTTFSAGEKIVNSEKVKLVMSQCEQETKYYCGPATTRQTLLWLKGTAPSQSTIADALGTTTNGTDGTKIVSYLNKKQTKHAYVISNSTDATTIKSRIVTAINGANSAPVIGRLKFDKSSDWAYSTNGHFVNISGYSVGMKEIFITDPNITRVNPKASGTYRVSFTSLHNAIKSHPLHHIYW